MNRLVVFDLETGGLDSLHHPVIQAAAAACAWPSLEIVELWEAKLVFDESAADHEALNITGYDRDVWRKSAVRADEAWASFAAFLSRHATVEMISKRTGRPYKVARLAAYNSEFDWPFVRRDFAALDRFLPAAFSVLCVLQRVRWFFMERVEGEQPKSHRLEDVATFLGVRLSMAHDAAADAEATVGVLAAVRSLEALTSHR